jgi:hypothetical protein
MVIEVEATLEVDPAIPISDVVLTIGHDCFDRIGYSAVVTDLAPEPLFEVGKVPVRRSDLTGAAYYMIRQGFISGDSVAIHTMCRGPTPLSAIEPILGEGPQGLVAKYAFPGNQRGARLVAREAKVITGGGLYDRVSDYVGLIGDAVAAKSSQRVAHDLSISYDYGVTINAFAKCFAGRAADIVPNSPISAEQLRSWFDQYFDYYFDVYINKHTQQPNTIFSRELAFVTLGAMTMYRATGDENYRRRLGQLCDVLLEFERRFDDGSGQPASGFLMRQDSPRVAYVDCHSAALLALTLAARFIDDTRLPAAIDRGLAGYGLDTHRGDGAVLDTIGTMMVDEHGNRNRATAFWNFQAGMTLRFFGALRNSPTPAVRAVAARHGERLDLLEMMLNRQLERSMTEHRDGVEMRCSVFHHETNSETQPWAMMGLLGHPAD